jgi:medium-chain acyl-[acyl-carrier-protein] hydrolase
MVIMDPKQFEKEYRVHVYDTGPDGRIALWSLFNYMQDIASEHAIRLGFGRDDLMKRNQFWVLSRMYAEIECHPHWEEKINVTTWPNGTDKLFAMRNYEVNYPDGRHIASGVSSWLIIDRESRKIQRPDWLLTQFKADEVKIDSPLRNPEKLTEMPEGTKSSTPFRVCVSDLDVNLHTNNVNYIKWVCDTYDLRFAMTHLPSSAEINYLAESMFGDEIVISTSEDEVNPGVISHSIVRTGDNKELCRIRIKWIDHKE